MKIAVIGAGAMGGLFAARFADAGQDVSLVEVSRAQIEAIERVGLRLVGESGEKTYFLPIGNAVRYRAVFDLLVIFTKGMHTRSAMAEASHLIGPQTKVLTLQNGIGNVETIKAFVPAERIIMGMTNWPSTLVAPGHIRVPGEGEVRIWSASDAFSAELEDINKLLQDAGLNCTLDPAVKVAIWEKLAFNAAMNTLAAAADMTVGEMADQQEAREIVIAILSETLAVAKALAIDVDVERTCRSVEHAFAHHRAHKPSMLQDRLAGRPMEIGTIPGAVAREGKRVGVPTPVTEAFANLLMLMDRRDPGAPSCGTSPAGPH